MTNTQYQNLQLENAINQYESQSKIDLSFRQLTDDDIDIVVKQAIIEKQCKILLLNDNLITSKGITILANTLSTNTTLEELNLWNNNISDAGVYTLSQVLSMKNPTLRSLGLGQNKITDIGAEHIAEMLKTNKTITRLWLFHNEIGDHGIQLIADVLAHGNKTLEWFDLRLNKCITDVSFDSLSNMLTCNQTLKKFWMEYCNLSPPIKAKLRETGQAKQDFNMGA